MARRAGRPAQDVPPRPVGAAGVAHRGAPAPWRPPACWCRSGSTRSPCRCRWRRWPGRCCRCWPWRASWWRRCPASSPRRRPARRPAAAAAARGRDPRDEVRRERRGAASRSRSPTRAPTTRRCAASTSTSRRASWRSSSAAPARARARCSASSTAPFRTSAAACCPAGCWSHGRDTRTHRPRDLADLVGVVGQDPLAGFVTDTVEEELAYAMEQLALPAAVMRKRVEETLDVLGIAELRDAPLRELSGGQQQRVAIGSVLTAHPRVLVLDEPTSALDPTGAEEVLAAMTRLVHDLAVTVLVAEHRVERVLQYADRVVHVGVDGRVTDGPPAELMRTSDVAPPVVELGRWAGWDPLPLSVRDARRAGTRLRSALAATSTPSPEVSDRAPAPARRGSDSSSDGPQVSDREAARPVVRLTTRRRRRGGGAGAGGGGPARGRRGRRGGRPGPARRRGHGADGAQRRGQVLAAVGAAGQRHADVRTGARRRRGRPAPGRAGPARPGRPHPPGAGGAGAADGVRPAVPRHRRRRVRPGRSRERRGGGLVRSAARSGSRRGSTRRRTRAT